MAAEFTFESKKAKEFFGQIISKVKNLEDSKEIIGLFSTHVFRDIMDHFKNEEGPNGKWQPWSRVYAAHLEKIGRSGNKILQFSGLLRQSFQPNNVKKVDDGLMWFNTAPYSARHDEGLDGMPQRQFMWLSKSALDKLASQVIRYVESEKSNGR